MVKQGQGGVIINMSSILAILALPDQVPYCVSKGAINQLTKVIALSLANRGIRVNVIGPGIVSRDLMKVVVHNEEIRRKFLQRTPLGRIAEGEEIARVAVFLASDGASYLIGQMIYPDEGRLVQALPVDIGD